MGSYIQDWTQASQMVKSWQQAGLEVVFTNGCFDLIHLGHLTYLTQAAALGDKLVIGLNSSASVGRLKGAHRPIKDEITRASLLAALAFVDLVVIFEEDTPLDLIHTLQPDVLVKGGDYDPEDIVGASDMKRWGGTVQVLSFMEGYSTTALEQKIRSFESND
ncbi:MAG: D-glycero-beta-D-manno-heptose 1-phosphate adenylyltransferase [Saprospiraceae bacterium]|nr:D-glycero-beta-D-manno-heptose 1-phosphate adenylyltransferase [Saprospiraceae bacterium]